MHEALVLATLGPAEHCAQNKPQDPTPRLIIDYQEIPLLFSQDVVNKSCNELWELHAWLLLKLSINTGVHYLHCIILKEDKKGKRVE